MPIFRIHVERLDAEGNECLTFEAKNHDDILGIVRRMEGRPELGPAEAAALAVGLKLFGEVLLKYRKVPPYAELEPHLRNFILALKGPKPEGSNVAVASVA